MKAILSIISATWLLGVIAVPAACTVVVDHDIWDWEIELIDADGEWTQGLDMAIYDAETLHMVSNLNDFNDLELINYALYDDGTWSFEVVADEVLTYNFPSILVGSDGDPRIIYEDDTLRYCVRHDDSWSIENLTARPYIDRTIAFSLDSDDQPWILWSYVDYILDIESFNLTWHNGNEWSEETLDLEPEGVTLFDIVHDDDDTLHCFFSKSNDGGSVDVLHMTRSGGSWDNEVVDTLDDDRIVDMGAEVDASGGIHLAYSTQTVGGVYTGFIQYAYMLGGVWETVVIDECGISIIDLYLDRNGEPGVVYNGKDVPRYAQRIDGEWKAGNLGIDWERLGHYSCVFDDDGAPLILCATGAQSKLYYDVEPGLFFAQTTGYHEPVGESLDEGGEEDDGDGGTPGFDIPMILIAVIAVGALHAVVRRKRRKGF